MKKKIVRRQVADKTRANIIKAALKLFAEHGFSGTATRAIAKAANVNETLIFHHFGNKAELWKKVKEHVVSNLAIEPLDLQPSSLNAFLEAVIQQRLSAYQKRPDLVRLVQWQRLEEKQDILAAGHILAPQHWHAPIKYLQETKKIKSNIAPETIIIWLQVSINAMIFDNIPFLQNTHNHSAYVNCLLKGFENALAS